MISSNCTRGCWMVKNEQLHEGLGDTTHSTPLAVRRVVNCGQLKTLLSVQHQGGINEWEQLDFVRDDGWCHVILISKWTHDQTMSPGP